MLPPHPPALTKQHQARMSSAGNPQHQSLQLIILVRLLQLIMEEAKRVAMPLDQSPLLPNQVTPIVLNQCPSKCLSRLQCLIPPCSLHGYHPFHFLMGFQLHLAKFLCTQVSCHHSKSRAHSYQAHWRLLHTRRNKHRALISISVRVHLSLVN